MDKLKILLNKSLSEIDEWIKNPIDGDKQAVVIESRLKTIINRAISSNSQNEFEQEIGSAMHLISDEGPLDSRFTPSLDEVSDILYRMKKRKS